MAGYDPNYDYTQEQAANPDDFEIADVATIDKSAEQIEAENGFRDVPPGEHLFLVVGLGAAPEINTFKVMLDGKMTSYTAYSARVKFALANDPRAQMSDFFVFPPATDAELPAYFHGVPVEKASNPNAVKGFSASKFFHFLGALGYTYTPGDKMPVEARRPANWKGKPIIGTVQAGRGTYTDRKTGKEMPSNAQLKMFSWRKASGPPPGASSAGSASRTTHTPLPGQTSFIPTSGAGSAQEQAHSGGSGNPVPTPTPAPAVATRTRAAKVAASL